MKTNQITASPIYRVAFPIVQKQVAEPTRLSPVRKRNKYVKSFIIGSAFAAAITVVALIPFTLRGIILQELRFIEYLLDAASDVLAMAIVTIPFAWQSMILLSHALMGGIGFAVVTYLVSLRKSSPSSND